MRANHISITHSISIRVGEGMGGIRGLEVDYKVVCNIPEELHNSSNPLHILENL